MTRRAATYERMRTRCILTDEMAREALKIAQQEVARLLALGVVPCSMDRSDLISLANEAIAAAGTCEMKLLRICVRRDLLDGLRKERRLSRGIEVPAIYTESFVSLNLAELAAMGISEVDLLPVRLVYKDELTLKEAAARLGLKTHSAVHKRLRKSIKEIQRILRTQEHLPRRESISGCTPKMLVLNRTASQSRK